VSEEASNACEECREIREIEALKARYFRFLDSKDWEAWRSLFTDDFKGLYPASHMSAYGSSKYAVLGFAETLRLELANE
jgi:NAD(P)-dependent dehydrogenase (short-subunit alcohol dehydrogenase family)